jgi:prepilin-type N-terminal cleavage/methylation domain-containing protein
MHGKKNKNGFGLVEIIVSIAIVTLIGTFASSAWTQYIKVNTRSNNLSRSAIITSEVSEALIMWRDTSWSTRINSLTKNTPYYVSWNGSAYATSTTAVAFQGLYAASFTLSQVNRDGSSNVVSSGGTLDANTLKATVVVSLLSSTSTPIATSELLIHNVYSN